jgi:predicted HTH transcriptional regulator
MNPTRSLELFADLTPQQAGQCGSFSESHGSAPSRGPLNKEQREVIRLLKERGTLTIAEAVKIFGRHIYCNATDHIGRRLARMVKRGLIVRLKPGVFALPNASGEPHGPNT